MKKTLVEQARAVKTKRQGRITKQEMDLAIEWANKRISLTAVSRVLGYKDSSPNGAYVRLALALQAYFCGDKI